MCHPQGIFIAGETYKTIENIKADDKVYGHDGKLHRVKETFKRHHIGAMMRIKCSSKLPLEMTPNHPILVYRPCYSGELRIKPDHVTNKRNRYINKTLVEHNKKQPIWIAAGEVKIGDYLLSPKPQYPDDATKAVCPDWTYKSKACRQVKKMEANSDMAWLLGLYVADGNATNSRLEITLHKDETKYAEKCIKCFEQLGVKPKIRKVKDKNAIRVSVHSTILAKSFREWFGKGKEKNLPDFVFTGWNLRAVLDGIFAGDGCIRKCKSKKYKIIKQIATTSSKLREQIVGILLHLGEIPYVDEAKWKNKPETWNPLWIVRWTEGEKNKICRQFENYVAMPVRSVLVQHYDGEVYNFEVEDVHSYLANHIAVHNCIQAYWNHPTLGEIFYILNSWGPRTHGTDPAGGPPGGFWVKKSEIDYITRQGDSFAFSQFDGFPAQKLDWYMIN